MPGNTLPRLSENKTNEFAPALPTAIPNALLPRAGTPPDASIVGSPTVIGEPGPKVVTDAGVPLGPMTPICRARAISPGVIVPVELLTLVETTRRANATPAVVTASSVGVSPVART